MKLLSRAIAYGELLLSLSVGAFFSCVLTSSVRMFFVGLLNKISARAFHNILANSSDHTHELISHVSEE